MSRSYRKMRPHKDWVYSRDAVVALYDISENTLTNWQRQGLRHVEGTRPRLYRGAELLSFHEMRRALAANRLRQGEFKCFRCKLAVLPEAETILFDQRANKANWLASSRCPECKSHIFKLLDVTEYTQITEMASPNATRDLSGEGEEHIPAGIVVSQDAQLCWNPNNEKVIHAWLAYAQRYVHKTVLAHLADIRRFEASIGLKDLSETSQADVLAYRNGLINGARGMTNDKVLSASTVRHAASYLTAFFTWLADREGSSGLRALIAYFALPKALHQAVALRSDKGRITISDAANVLEKLPAVGIVARRDRAIFALAYIGAMRESALISLRVKHLDLEARRIAHNGRELRAKNGKSFFIKWFPGTEPLQSALIDWVQEITALGAAPEDAVFPDARVLIALEKDHRTWAAKKVWQPMKSASTVDRVFRHASGLAGVNITPHSARHTIAALGEQCCASRAEWKAWSLNMGHESETTTSRNYGRMSAAEKERVIAEMVERSPRDSTVLKEILSAEQAAECLKALKKATAFMERICLNQK